MGAYLTSLLAISFHLHLSPQLLVTFIDQLLVCLCQEYQDIVMPVQCISDGCRNIESQTTIS